MKHEFKYKHFDKNTIYIQIDIITICNQHCWYCYARPESNPGAKWNRIMKFTDAKKMLDGMKTIKYNIVLSILGGEPTLHPQLNDIIAYACSIKNITSVEVFTNGRRPLKLQYHKKLFVNFSFHPSQTDGDGIIENSKFLISKNIPFAISCLYEKESDCFYNFIDKLKKNGLFHLVNIGIVDSHIPSRPLKVTIPDNDVFKHANEKDFIYDREMFTVDEIRDKHMNDFYGWTCYKHCLKILVDSTVHIVGGNNEVLDFNQFKNYKVRADICDGHCCSDDNNLTYNRKVLL